MANRLFRSYVHALMTGTALDLSTVDLRVVAIDTADDDPNTAIGGDDFLDDILAAAREGTTTTLANVTVVDGVLDADDITLPDDGGDTIEELVIYNHTGTESTSRLLALIDTATGLPLTPDGVDDTIQWSASGIYAL